MDKNEKIILKESNFQISATRNARIYFLLFLVTINLAYFSGLYILFTNNILTKKNDFIQILSLLITFINFSLFGLYLRDEIIGKEWGERKNAIYKQRLSSFLINLEKDKFKGGTIFIIIFLFLFFILFPLYLSVLIFCHPVSFYQFFCASSLFGFLHFIFLLQLFRWIQGPKRNNSNKSCDFIKKYCYHIIYLIFSYIIIFFNSFFLYKYLDP